MFSFGKSKRVVNIVIDEYAIRMVENNGNDLTSITNTAEKILPTQLIENGKIVDELGFFEFIKEVVEEWGIKKRRVRFYAPQEQVIMREIELAEEVRQAELRQYITMEIGHTIHFPFKNPVFDLYDTKKAESENKVTVLAAPEEELIKYTEIFDDATLEPIAVDVQPLGIYRYFTKKHIQNKQGNVYLFIELNLTSVNFSVFHNDMLEFLRFQQLNYSIDNWQHNESQEQISWEFAGDETHLHNEVEDQLNEIDRIMNFYRFSIHQGEKTVSHIVLLGDYPYLNDVKQRIENRYDLQTIILTTKNMTEIKVNSTYIPALGLALKGGH